MEDTTTPVDGVATDAAVTNAPATTQPAEPPKEEPEAVTDTTDQPKVQAEESKDKSQADDKSELKGWIDKKGLEINFDNPNEVKLAEMQLNAEKKMHQATQKVEPPEEVPLTGNEAIDEIVNRQNTTDIKLYVRDWFDNNPDMKDHRDELTKIANDRPWLQNMDDVKAHFLADPGRAAQLKSQGGKEALTNLAQKQQAIPPTANATNSADYSTGQITPENVEQLVAENDMAWYQANRSDILKASGQS